MIRYSDYNGPQDDVVNRDGEVVPFDRDAARDAARHAHVLAMNAPQAAAPEADTVSPRGASLAA